MTGITCMILGKWRPDGQKINGQWYYFWPFTENGHIQGTMAYGGWKIIGADYYFFREDGSFIYRLAGTEWFLVLFKHTGQQPSGSHVYRLADP